MNCPNCKSNSWENVDNARIKPSGMSICNDCGFISYPEKWKSPDEIKAHYRSEYRQPPTHQNCYAGERKNHFHHSFLNDLFKEWKAKGLTKPKICEVGAAFGYSLNWFRKVFPEAEVYGTELTTSFRRNAAHQFGIILTEDMDTSIKYDLIMSYKVLEHQLDPDLELEKYSKCLSPDGRLYMSVPTWFNSLYDFGRPGFDLEYYYDTNHVNVWTTPMFEGLMNNKGFEIIKNNQVIYASTYLCKFNPELVGKPVVKEDPADIKQKLKIIKEAFLATTEARYADAIALWPDYPTAWISDIEMHRKEMQTIGWGAFKEKWINPFIAACPNSPDALITATDFAMRAESWPEAIEFCEQALLAKPENPTSLHHMAIIMRELAIREKGNGQLHYFAQAREVANHLLNTSAHHAREATDLIFVFNSKLPFKGEALARPTLEENLSSLRKTDAGNDASL